MIGQAPAFDLWNVKPDHLSLTGQERELAWHLGQQSRGPEAVSGNHCDQMRLDSDETLETIDKFSPT
jgi:hypothetical protein